MSDDNKDGDWDANEGVSLPLMSNATHNIGLSPLFFNKSGDSEIYTGATSERSLAYRGYAGLFLSSIVMNTDMLRGYNRYLYASYWAARPSGRDANFHPASLRCLVSTTNS